jgi:ATP phosphoribosyltransferase regulatory subunit
MSPAATTADNEALDAEAGRLMAAFVAAGYERIAPDIIQPAGLFLDVIGESLRGRTYVFTDPDGHELCLRPDLTVPTCRWHLERHPDGNAAARYCYSGSTFRYQPVGADRAHPREFHQAGIEAFGSADREADDAAVLVLIMRALGSAGLSGLQIRIGDLGLFRGLVNAIAMPERWRRRLKNKFWRPDAFRAELARLRTGPAAHGQGLPRELMDALDPADKQDATVRVLDHLDRSGVELIGTRTAGEIAERLLAEAADLREPPLAAETVGLIERYVAVKAPAHAAVDRLGDLAHAHGVNLKEPLDGFRRRLALIEAAGISMQDAEFSAEFGRNLEYYTGFVFEVTAPALGPRSPIAGGGRYDSLLADVGAPQPVPAVGASVHTERLLAVLRGAQP